jgi:hypothetical protein
MHRRSVGDRRRRRRDGDLVGTLIFGGEHRAANRGQCSDQCRFRLISVACAGRSMERKRNTRLERVIA